MSLEIDTVINTMVWSRYVLLIRRALIVVHSQYYALIVFIVELTEIECALKRSTLCVKKTVYLHADNCVGQNKNNYVLSYLLWSGRHTQITLSFLVVGHTKFAPDWSF